MNSQPKVTKNGDRNKTTANSKFANMINKDHDENRGSEINKKSTLSVNKQPQSSLRCPSNVLSNNTTFDNTRNISNSCSRFSPSRQYYKSPSASQSNIMTSSRMQQNRGDVENSRNRNASIFTSSGGVIHISLRHGVRIDITVDNSIQLTSCGGQIVISLSNTGDSTTVRHPNGLIQQIGKFVQIAANDQSQSNNSTRYASMNDNGITFTSSALGDVFILDTIGTRQTTKFFAKLIEDNPSTAFLSKSKHGPSYNDEALQLIQKASIKICADDVMDVITINDYRIWQMKDGLVTVARMSFPLKIRTSPLNCSFTLTTSHIHCTASSKESAHLFVRCHHQSMHYDGQNFVVRYNGNSAGFDKNEFLIVY